MTIAPPFRSGNCVVINEVGPRDGLQGEKSCLNPAAKLDLISSLVAAGLRHIEATSFVSSKAIPQMADAEEVFAALPAPGEVAYSALIVNLKGYERAARAGVRTVAVAIGSTESINQRNVRCSLTEALQGLRLIASQARRDRIAVHAYIGTAIACPYEGSVNPAAVADIASRMLDDGADCVTLADTIGAGDPVRVAVLLESVLSRFPAARFAFHLHDTRGLAIACAWVAFQHGIRRFDGSIGGLGGCPFAPGASGNVATEDLASLFEHCGVSTGVTAAALLSPLAVAERLLGRPLGGRSAAWLKATVLRNRIQSAIQ